MNGVKASWEKIVYMTSRGAKRQLANTEKMFAGYPYSHRDHLYNLHCFYFGKWHKGNIMCP